MNLGAVETADICHGCCDNIGRRKIPLIRQSLNRVLFPRPEILSQVTMPF